MRLRNMKLYIICQRCLLLPRHIQKNLFVWDDKKRNYYLIAVKGDKKVNLKEFKQKNNTRTLSFASENDLMTDLIPGAVTPLRILNNIER